MEEAVSQNQNRNINQIVYNTIHNRFRRARTDEARNIRKNALLEAAKQIFFENGYRNTTIKDITDRAGVSIGTFYLYFDNKLTIYKNVLFEGILQLEEHLRNSVKSIDVDTETAEKMIRILAKAYIEFYQRNPEYFDIIAVLNLTEEELRENHTKISKEIHVKARDILRFIESIIRLGKQKKEFKVENTSAAAITIWSLLEGILILNQRNNLSLLKQELNPILDFAIDRFITSLKV
ncbi:MAG: TetR/AcrR family transcriptional regulator [Leptospiraceae bacterium]|nr:TetR/AcrR family transcriptional regulator [Leptospiraceae bacterium]MDW7976486.1 TetR/AcrR family transcriptional regulator [Leptospiraceae bacterium]